MQFVWDGKTQVFRLFSVLVSGEPISCTNLVYCIHCIVCDSMAGVSNLWGGTPCGSQESILPNSSWIIMTENKLIKSSNTLLFSVENLTIVSVSRRFVSGDSERVDRWAHWELPVSGDSERVDCWAHWELSVSVNSRRVDCWAHWKLHVYGDSERVDYWSH